MASRSISAALAYKLAANTHAVPLSWEWGTLNHECIAGITACVDYLADLGRHADPSLSGPPRCASHCLERDPAARTDPGREPHLRGLYIPRAEALWHQRSEAIQGSLSHSSDSHCRPSTAALATELGRRGFFTWDGNYYAVNLPNLDLEKDGGFLRIGLAH